MSYRDKKFGFTLPTRTGTPLGGSGERQMLDRLGGSVGYRKEFRTEPDGSVTMLTTKNGMPQFSRLTDGNGAADITTLYMETGQLAWSFPGVGNPTRFDAAKWHFLDIAVNDAWLGKIAKDGVQDSKQTLAEGQDSLAIGPPSEASKELYGGATVGKKMAAAVFPPSLFSGKMRLFMQAQYGATQELAPKLNIESTGSSVSLIYTYNNTPLQFGFWPHGTTGLFKAADGVYFLVNLALSGTHTVITYYPIIFTKAATALLAANPGSEKAEAYAFASASINTQKPKIVSVPVGADGTSLAYGWKFNSDGSEARIVVHETLNPASLSNVRWHSRTVTVELGYSGTEVTATANVDSNGEWIDGWGTYNIFVPETEVSTAPLSLMSLRVGSPRRGSDFVFSGVEVYGYYVDDTWESSKISFATLPASDTQTTDALFVNPSDEALSDNWQYSFNFANVPLNYLRTEIFDGFGMTLVIGGASYGGITQNGRWSVRTTNPTYSSTVDNPVGFCGNFVGTNYGGPTAPGFIFSTGGGANGGGFIEGGPMTRTLYVFTGLKYSAWAFVIPGQDCCAAYAATRESDGVGTYSQTATTVPISATRFTGTVASFIPYRLSWEWGTWSGYGPGTPVAVSTTPSPPATISEVYCFNAAISGSIGTAGGSLTGLFDVAYTYPYYDRGMYTYTSHGKRYVMSEGLKNPASVDKDRRFVGWA